MISSINYKNNNTVLNTNSTKQKKKAYDNGVDLPGTKRLNIPPVAVGAINGFCWYGVGMFMDKLASKLFKFSAKTPIAHITSAIIGAFMAVSTYNAAKKNIKSA